MSIFWNDNDISSERLKCNTQETSSTRCFDFSAAPSSPRSIYFLQKLFAKPDLNPQIVSVPENDIFKQTRRQSKTKRNQSYRLCLPLVPEPALGFAAHRVAQNHWGWDMRVSWPSLTHRLFAFPALQPRNFPFWIKCWAFVALCKVGGEFGIWSPSLVMKWANQALL